MTRILENVARAIAIASNDYSGGAWPIYTRQARAALEAAGLDELVGLLREAYVRLDCDESDAEICDKIKALLAKVQS